MIYDISLTYLVFPYPCVQLRQDGLRLLTLWLQALQSNAGDASMQLFASAVPHFPPQKTPMGLPSPSSSSSLHPHPSTHSLVERYGTYSSSDGASYLSAYRRASSASVNSFRGESVMTQSTFINVMVQSGTRQCQYLLPSPYS